MQNTNFKMFDNMVSFTIPKGFTDSQVKKAQLLYKDYFTYYMFHIYELAIGRWEWVNLNNMIPEGVPEQILIQTGMAVIFKDEYGQNFLPASIQGMPNIYGVPTTVKPYPWAGGPGNIFESKKPYVDCAIIQNNFNMHPDIWFINYYAHQMATLRSIKMVNIKSQQTTQIIATDAKQKSSVQKVVDAQEEGSQKIYTTPNFDKDTLSVFNAVAPYVADKMSDQEQQLWSECMTKLGISNNKFEKKERMVTDEVNSNNDETSRNVLLQWKLRDQACKVYNDIYPSDKPLQVKYNGVTLDEYYNLTENAFKKMHGVDDGSENENEKEDANDEV